MKRAEEAPTLVLFDFGGVIAEEGFKAAITTLAEENGRNVAETKKIAFDLVYETGLVTGRATDREFWPKFREATGISGSDDALAECVLSRFVVRPEMVQLARNLKASGFRTAILSDQTHWLNELERRNGFSSAFEAVFNSWDLGITKKDPAIFRQVLETLGADPSDAVFIDDHAPHLARAREMGLFAIRYEHRDQFASDFTSLFGFPPFPS